MHRFRLQKDKPRWFEKLSKRLLPFDHMVLLYCWFIVVLTINFARPLDHYLTVLLFHFCVILLVGLLAWYSHGKKDRGVIFFRLLYPIILMTFFYQMTGKLVLTVVPGFFDGQIIEIEKIVLGFNPTLWLDSHLNVFFTELLSLGYFSYYFIIPTLPLLLFFQKRDRELKRLVTASCATFFVSYVVFIIYPATGPRFYLQPNYLNDITGPVFRPLVMLVINNAAFKGGAMPSSHVAEALVMMFFALRIYKRKAWFLALLVLLLSLGTIYGRFHYVSDVLVGILIGTAAYVFTLYLYPISQGEDEPDSGESQNVGYRYASRYS